MNIIFRFFRGFDGILFLVVIILSLLSLASVYSIDLSRGSTLIYFPKQALAFFLGTIVLFVSCAFHQSFYEKNAKFFYIFSLLLLIAVLFFGVDIRGTKGWFQIFGFSFQPVEFAKIGLILFMAYWISRQGRKTDTWQYPVLSGVITGILATLVFLQPDLGSALVLGGIWFFLLLFTGTKKRYIFCILLLLILGFVFGWLFLFKDYQKARFATFLDPSLDPLGSGYNITQSIIAVGAGNFFGRGLGFGSQSQLHFLPEAQSDFIFSVIAEELGFVGVSMVLSLYFIFFWRLIKIMQRARDDFSYYVILGIFFLFIIQVSINIGAALGMMPLTGITLSFLSYGGSSILINYFIIGVAQSIARSST